MIRTILCVAVLAHVVLRAEEPRPDGMRAKLRAKILEAAPAPLPAEAATEKPGNDVSIVVMKPVVVSESPHRGDLHAAIVRERQKKEDEQFTPTKGGTIYRKEIGKARLELGGWWADGVGWKFMKISW